MIRPTNGTFNRKKTAVTPRGIPRVVNLAWYSLNDICLTWQLPDDIRLAIVELLQQRGKGFEFEGDYFAFGESIMRAFWDAKKAADAIGGLE